MNMTSPGMFTAGIRSVTVGAVLLSVIWLCAHLLWLPLPPVEPLPVIALFAALLMFGTLLAAAAALLLSVPWLLTEILWRCIHGSWHRATLRWMPVVQVLALWTLCLWWGGGIWLQRQRVAAALEHAEPLLQTVERHAAAHGRPPASLAELVPAPSPAMLSTGLMGEPQYAYRILEHDTSA